MTRAMRKFVGWLIAIVVLLIIFLFMGPLYIVNEGNKGGSPVAAAIVNAVLYSLKE